MGSQTIKIDDLKNQFLVNYKNKQIYRGSLLGQLCALPIGLATGIVLVYIKETKYYLRIKSNTLFSVTLSTSLISGGIVGGYLGYRKASKMDFTFQ